MRYLPEANANEQDDGDGSPKPQGVFMLEIIFKIKCQQKT
jgi:hypothetical protein